MISDGILVKSDSFVRPKAEKFSLISFFASEICKTKFK